MFENLEIESLIENCELKIENFALFVPQRFNRIQIRRPPSRIEPKHNPDDG
jgi:hypothetical protein